MCNIVDLLRRTVDCFTYCLFAGVLGRDSSIIHNHFPKKNELNRTNLRELF